MGKYFATRANLQWLRYMYIIVQKKIHAFFPTKISISENNLSILIS